MITVPVFDSFSNNTQIGTLTIDETRLPADPDYCFALGFNAELGNLKPGQIPTTKPTGPYTLGAVAIASDEAYSKYLHQIGVSQSDDGDSTREARG